MKKKIAILGSTGSIGKCLIDIIKKDKRNFEIILLSADKNYKELLKPKLQPEDFYWEEGKMVMTEKYHLKRGSCCSNGCKHCPYKQNIKC